MRKQPVGSQRGKGVGPVSFFLHREDQWSSPELRTLINLNFEEGSKKIYAAPTQVSNVDTVRRILRKIINALNNLSIEN